MKAENCPNCGAPVEGRKCLYCGTRFQSVKGGYDGETYISTLVSTSGTGSFLYGGGGGGGTGSFLYGGGGGGGCYTVLTDVKLKGE